MKEITCSSENNRNILPEAYLEIVVMPEELFLYLRRGRDITKLLEEELKIFGLKCSINFKSPCG